MDPESPTTVADGGRTVRREAVVPDDCAGERLDRIAARMFDDFSRMELSRWIQAGALTVDGQVSPPKRRLLGGETLLLDGAPRALPAWQTPQAIDLDVVFEDDDVLVLNKPAGLVVHPGAGQPDGTLVNALLHYRPAQAALPRAGIVHRLDKDTSGLLVVATSSRAHGALVAALAERRVSREYVAVVEGVPSGGFDIEAPIGRDPRHRTRQAVLAHGRYALTHVRLSERFAAHALIDARLATGRTHQIRVHLAHRGFPLVGDKRYGARGRLPPDASTTLRGVIGGFQRQALHAARLSFVHPGRPVPDPQRPVPGEDRGVRDAVGGVSSDEPGDGRLTFAAPPPADFAQLLAALRDEPSP